MVWHRRSRKTTTAIIELVRQAIMRPGMYWHVFPTYAEAKDAVWREPKMLFHIIPEEFIWKKNESELIVYLRPVHGQKQGGIIQLKGADKPERLLGAGPVGVVLDEFAEMQIEAWTRIVEPIVRANGGWCWFIGTPRGKNHLFTFYQRGQQENSEWKSWLLTGDTSGIYSQEQLEIMRSKGGMTEQMFAQEILCNFLESTGTVFRNLRRIMISQPQQPIAGHLYIIGADLAKTEDFTVLTVYDRMTNSQVYQNRIQDLDWNFQKEQIKQLSKHYNNARVIIDATGVGDPIADDLIRSGISVDPIKFTEEIKRQLIEKLMIWVEQGRMRMIPQEETLLEFDNFSYEIGPTGKTRYQAREGFHDDIVIAHALAIWALQPLVPSTVIEDQPPLRQYHWEITGRYKRPQREEWEE